MSGKAEAGSAVRGKQSSTSNSTGKSVWYERPLWIVVSLTVLFVFWISWPALSIHWLAMQNEHDHALESLGLFGDSFGGFNSFFSALAFGMLVLNAFQQGRQLKMQQMEIEDAAKEQKKLRRQELRALHTQSFITCRDILQDERVRKARGIVLEIRKQKQNPELQPWDEDQVDAAETVCHTFDTVGLMIRFKMVHSKHLVESWRTTICETWEVLNPFVYKIRFDRDSPDFWNGYESLASLAQVQSATEDRPVA